MTNMKKTINILRVIALSLLIILLGFLFRVAILGYHEKSKKNVYCDSVPSVNASQTESHRVEILEQMSMAGDYCAYQELFVHFMKEPPEGAMLAHSIIMANKYNNDLACSNVYLSLLNFYGYHSIDSLDNETQRLTIHFMKKAAALNREDAILDMKELKRNGKWKKEFDDVR